ncbi:hypothetical protein BH24ACT10_BH24ACT10_05940 [soil metagenome]
MTARVVLVRGARTSVGGGGGCCSGDVRPFDEGGGHAHPAPPGPEAELYRALRAMLPPEIGVEVVSPSNWLWLVPELVRGGRRRGLRGSALLAAVRSGLAVSSLLVDGRALFSGGLPPAATAVAAVRAELALR